MAYTQLTPTATPGQRYTFTPKSPVSGKGAGLFTELSPLAIPGGRHSFTVKQEVEYKPEVAQTYYGSGAGERRSYYDDEIKARQRERILRDDEEILDVLIQVIISDIL